MLSVSPLKFVIDKKRNLTEENPSLYNEICSIEIVVPITC
jgi:hypothetical protein